MCHPQVTHGVPGSWQKRWGGLCTMTQITHWRNVCFVPVTLGSHPRKECLQQKTLFWSCEQKLRLDPSPLNPLWSPCALPPGAPGPAGGEEMAVPPILGELIIQGHPHWGRWACPDPGHGAVPCFHCDVGGARSGQRKTQVMWPGR